MSTKKRLVKLPSPRIEIKRATNKEFYAVVIAKNGKQVWKTSETYKRKASVRNALELIGGLWTQFEPERPVLMIAGEPYPIIDLTLSPSKK